ncbi:hypothetical protein AVEN_41006-1, partial [Araneus ventricosus]
MRRGCFHYASKKRDAPNVCPLQNLELVLANCTKFFEYPSCTGMQVPTCTDDDFLLMFLRSKKFNITKGFEQLKSYSFQRHFLMNYYGFLSADKIMPAFHHNICGVLPKRDHEGRAIIYLLP